MRHLIRDVFNKSWMNAVAGIVPVFTLVSGIGVTVQAVANTLDNGALIVEIEDNSGLTDGDNPHWVLLVMLAPGGTQDGKLDGLGKIANPVFKSGPKWTGSWGQPSEALANVGGNIPNIQTLPSNPNGTWMAFAAHELHGLTGIGDGHTSTGFVDWSSSFITESNGPQKVFPSMGVFLAFIPTADNEFPPLQAFGSKFNDTTKNFQYPYALVTPSGGEALSAEWYHGTDSTIRSSPFVAGALTELPLAMPNGADSAKNWFLTAEAKKTTPGQPAPNCKGTDCWYPAALTWSIHDGQLHIDSDWDGSGHHPGSYVFPTTGPFAVDFSPNGTPTTLSDLTERFALLYIKSQDTTHWGDLGQIAQYHVIQSHGGPIAEWQPLNLNWARNSDSFASDTPIQIMSFVSDQNIAMKSAYQPSAGECPPVDCPGNMTCGSCITGNVVTGDWRWCSHCFQSYAAFHNPHSPNLPSNPADHTNPEPVWAGTPEPAPWGSGVRWQRLEYQMQTYPSAGEAAGDADITILSRFGFPVRLDYLENATDDPFSSHWAPASNVTPNVNKFESLTSMPVTDLNVRRQLQKAIRSTAPPALKLQTIIRAEQDGRQSQIALVGPNVFGNSVNPYNSFRGLNGDTQNHSYWQQVAERLPCIETSGQPDPEQGIHAGYCSSDNSDSLPTSLRIQSVNSANTVHSGNGAQPPTQDDYQHSVCDWYQNPSNGVEQYQCYACFTTKEYDVNDGSQTVQIDKHTLLITGELQPFTIDWLNVTDQDPSLWEGLNAKIHPDKPYILSPEKPKALFNLSYLHGLCDTSIEYSCNMYAEVGADGKTITISQECIFEGPPDIPFSHEVTVDISDSEWQDKTVADLKDYFVTPTNFARPSWVCDANCTSPVSCLSGESKTNQGFCQLLGTTGPLQQLENISLSEITLVQMPKTEIPKQDDNCSAQPLPDGLGININTDNASGAIYSGDWFGYANDTVSVTYGWNNQSGHLYTQGVVGQQENLFEIDIRKIEDHSQTAKVKVEYTTTLKNIARDLSAAFQYGMLPTNNIESTQQFKSINTTAPKTTRNLVLDKQGTPPGSSPFTLQEVPSGNWMLLNSYPPDNPNEIPIFEKLQPVFLGPDLWAFSRYAQLAYQNAGPEIYGQAYSDFLTTTKHPGIPIVWEDSKFVKLKITIPSLLDGDFDGNSQVDIADLLHILQYWGLPYGDLDGNETTDIMDLLMVINSFGD